MFWKRLLFTVIAGSGVIAAQAAPRTPDFTNLPAYIRALNRSKDPQAVAIRQEIADGPAALARERAACEADGIPLDPRSLQPPVPPDQDAAPLWAKWNTLRRDHLQLPNYAESLQYGYAYTPEQLARVQKIFDDNREAMDALHQAADKSALAGPGGSPEDTFPYYAQLREAARELRSESFLLAHQGRYAEAVNDQARGFHIAKQAASYPTLVNYLIGAAIEAMTLSGMRDMLYFSRPDTDVSAQVQHAIQAARPVLPLKSDVAGETAHQLSFSSVTRGASPTELLSLLQQKATTPPNSETVKIKVYTPDERRFVDNLLDASEAYYLSQMRQLVAATNQAPAVRRVAFSGIAATGSANNPVEDLGNYFLQPSLYPKLAVHEDQRVAQEEIILAAAAVLAAKARTGAFPDALPGDFPDPFTDKPLGYRREGDGGFVIFSVGADGKFDGGKPGQYEFHPFQVFFRYPGPSPQPVPPDQQ